MLQLISYIRRTLRYFYRKSLQKSNVTLITNNCIGGIIYHDMHLQFLSPTINLYFDNEEFIRFCTYLDEYLLLAVEECTSVQKSFPVGVLHGSHGDVHIYFMHYDSFEQAVAKWNERKERINFDNLYIIMEAQKCSSVILAKFNDIPYANKVILTDGIQEIAHSFPIRSDFYGESYWPGKLLEYPPRGLYRYMEQFDYVTFINKGKIKKRYV